MKKMKVEFQTLCGCSKIIDVSAFPGPILRVPIERPMITSDWYDIHVPFQYETLMVREFSFLRKEGSKFIYKEKLNEKY